MIDREQAIEAAEKAIDRQHFQYWASEIVDAILALEQPPEVPQVTDVDLRPFPMQDGPPIPWFVAEAVWRDLYRNDQPLQTVADRGGFGWDEVAYMWGTKHRTTKEQRASCRERIKTGLAALRAALGSEEGSER